jgi:BlaI family transcriptional regulator, penicillinase repressor
MPRFTDRELDVMAILWDLGEATVADVQSRLPDPLAYTTVLTVLRVLEEKGHVGHAEGPGRAYLYHPLVERAEAGSSALGRLVDRVFKGSPELLLTQLVSERELSDEELERMRRLLDEQLKERES